MVQKVGSLLPNTEAVDCNCAGLIQRKVVQKVGSLLPNIEAVDRNSTEPTREAVDQKTRYIMLPRRTVDRNGTLKQWTRKFDQRSYTHKEAKRNGGPSQGERYKKLYSG